VPEFRQFRKFGVDPFGKMDGNSRTGFAGDVAYDPIDIRFGCPP
jgi:hypothetical protein